MNKSVEVWVDSKNNITTLTAISSIRAAERDKLLSSKACATGTTVSSPCFQQSLVDEINELLRNDVNCLLLLDTFIGKLNMAT